jgi:hypothetical protein
LQEVTEQHLGAEAEVFPVHVYDVILLQELKKEKKNCKLLGTHITGDSHYTCFCYLRFHTSMVSFQYHEDHQYPGMVKAATQAQ